MSTSETAPPTGRAYPDEHLSSHATSLVLAMMASATTEKIPPMEWWPRAKTALLAACAKAKTWGELVTEMARKLQIEALRSESSKAICSMALGTADLRAFKRIVKEEAIYIVAEAQIIREQQREETKQ